MRRSRGHAVTQSRGTRAVVSCVTARLRDRATRSATIVIVLLTLTIAQSLLACPVCFGDPNSPMTKGTNNAIWFLLSVVGVVQIGFVALFFTFWKRARDQRRRFRLLEGGPLVNTEDLG
jgi:hypothetical protein